MKRTHILASVLSLGLVATLSGSAESQLRLSGPALVRLSVDPFTNAGSEHATEVEADTYAFGSTIVGTFQVGRFAGGGSSDIGWATSSDAGKTWKFGYLPGITKPENPKNPYPAASDPAVAFDAAHGVWLINSLPVPPGGSNPAVLVSRSTDALNWGNPVSVAAGPIGSDKNWITCDDTAASPFYGHCYVEWDDGNLRVHVNASTDGGKTWGPTRAGGNNAFGLGGQPLVQPNGTVVVPFSDGGGADLDIVSKDGGQTWSNAIRISPEADHGVATMRAPSLPSAQMDAAGTIYVAWHDCSFRAGCHANDIVFSSSTDGMHWTAKSRVPIDPTTSTVDHFLPGFGVDHLTAGANAHLGLTYFFFPKAACTRSTCQLFVGYVSSHNGGKTWSAPTTLAGPMNVTWLAHAGGQFVGDYLATAFTPDGLAHSVFAVASAPSGGKFNEAMFTTASGLPVTSGAFEFSSFGERPFPNAHSDHPRYHYPPKGKAKRAIEGD